MRSRGAVIYDIGCGPGRYTEYLINKGYFVGCVDLSEKSLAMFDERLQGANNHKVLFSRACCASELDWIDSDSADTILLLGPMYHITDEAKRKAVISHCHRILKKGGYVISMFLSPYPALIMQNNRESNLMEITEKENCMLTTTHFKGFMVPQYRCWPQHAITEFQHFFTETDIIHVDEVQHPKLHPVSKLNINEHYSHQYFVVYQKQVMTKVLNNLFNI
ncbi:MAG: class I SAM-dependent methyltransferase [Bacteroidales bacterium]